MVDYFNTGVHDAGDMITRSDDPGRHAAWFNYVHVAIIAGIVVGAVGNELAIDHPDRDADLLGTLVLCGGPALFLLGNGLYKLAVYRRWPLSHLVGLGLLAVLAGCAWLTDLLMVNALATAHGGAGAGGRVGDALARPAQRRRARRGGLKRCPGRVASVSRRGESGTMAGIPRCMPPARDDRFRRFLWFPSVFRPHP